MDPSPQSRDQASEQAAAAAGPVLIVPGPVRGRSSVWQHRISQLVLVVFCSWLGMVLVVLPWTQDWTQNRFLLHWPAVRDVLALNFVRGTASGLGVIDIWVGIWQAVNYHDRG
jgi:hypothetical protein